MYLIRLSLCIIILLISSVPVFSAEELSLSQAVEISIKNNPEISSADYDSIAAGFKAKSERAPANPEIFYAPTIAGREGSDSEALIVQPLEINGSRAVKAQIATSEASAVSSESSVKIRNIILQVKNAYWDFVNAQSFVASAEENIEYLQSVRKIIKRQIDTGLVPGSRLIKADVEISTAAQELMQAKMKLATAKAEFCLLLNLPQDTDIKTIEPQVFEPFQPENDPLVKLALENRPEIRLVTEKLNIARKQLQSAKLQTVPDLAVQARKTTMQEKGGVALVLSLPVIDWGAAGNEKKSCQILIKAREKECEAARKRILVEVGQAVHKLKTSAGIVAEFQSGTLEKAAQLNRMTQKGYEAGVLNYLELLESHRTMRLTELSYRNALTEYFKAIAQLEWAVGSSLPDLKKSEAVR